MGLRQSDCIALFLDLDAQVIINLPFVRDVVPLIFDVLDGLVDVSGFQGEEETIINVNKEDGAPSVVHAFVDGRLGEASLEESLVVKELVPHPAGLFLAVQVPDEFEDVLRVRCRGSVRESQYSRGPKMKRRRK